MVGAKADFRSSEGPFVECLQVMQVVVDLAHASSALLDTSDNRRNLSEELLRGVTVTSKADGIGYWKTAVCGDSHLP